MAVYESMVVIEDWVSEHYFTSDDKGTTFTKAVRERCKEFRADAKEGFDTPLTRLAGARQDLLARMATLDEAEGDLEGEAASEATAEACNELYARLRAALGITGEKEEISFERGSTDYVVEGLWVGTTTDTLWLDCEPSDPQRALTETTLIGTDTVDGKPRKDSAAKLVSNLYLSDPSPRFIVIATGSHLVLTERERWPEGRFLYVDVQLVLDRWETKQGGEVDRLAAMFSRDSLAAAADSTLWWEQRLEESREHSVGVSEDLRTGIRESIEIIANDVLDRRRDQGLDIDSVYGQELARESLRFLYRILFLLYAEASPELGVLPKGAGEYDAGYGLDRLRELVQVNLSSPRAENGTHIYDSLTLLFQLVNGEHSSQQQAREEDEIASLNGEDEDLDLVEEGLVFEPLKADLFEAKATALINKVGLGNRALQAVLERLLLTKASGKGERGFISYSNLGINQLGAVYEGLMSYTGFIAEQDLREVAPGGDPSKGSWVIAADSCQHLDTKDFVRAQDPETGDWQPVLHRAGSFVYRLSGRERQQSASFYTPEVLTRFVVSQALEELLGADLEKMSADEMLQLSICEPALGSGAFAIEATRQLAEAYLAKKQQELGQQIPSEDYPQELQRVKAQIALHQVYGVDLNDTAVELAEVSTWLDTMQPGLQAPWFGLRMKRGNSLVGARRASYSQSQVKRKEYLDVSPLDNPLTGLVADFDEEHQFYRPDPDLKGRVHHFLLPAAGWGSAVGAKNANKLAPEERANLRKAMGALKRKLTDKQVDRLVALSKRVEVLWGLVHQRMEIAKSEARRFIDYWPHERTPEDTSVTRSQIEQSLADPDSAYQRLKRVMNAWTGMWFWPLTGTDGIQPPSLNEWLDALEAILGKPGGKEPKAIADQEQLQVDLDWHGLDVRESLDLSFANALNHRAISREFPWLKVTDRLAREHGFFHWELEFPTVFSQSGFDLQVGNPPWVRPDWDEKAAYAEFDPWWQLVKGATQTEIKVHREAAENNPAQREFLLSMASEVTALREFLSGPTNYEVTADLRPDLYRSFMARTWKNMANSGVVSLIHPESHFTEKKATRLRQSSYQRLRRHWQFINELQLFEIDHHVSYGVHVYSAPQDEPKFLMAASLYHPETVERSLHHEGADFIPGLKDDEGNWDIRPHPDRIINVNVDTLTAWRDIIDDPSVPPLQARMVYPVNRESMTVLEKLAKAPRASALGLHYSTGWNETTDRRNGYFDIDARRNTSWDDVILQGIHFSVANPFAKEPNETMRNNLDTVAIDLEAMPEDFIPRTKYQPTGDQTRYDRAYIQWSIDGQRVKARSVYSIAWRTMASGTGYRTFYPALIPVGATHIFTLHGGYSTEFENPETLFLVLGQWSSIVLDFRIRAAQLRHILGATVDNLPTMAKNAIGPAIATRAAQLVCTTKAYAPLWEKLFGSSWTAHSPLRRDEERRTALVEIDALTAIMFDLTADELCAIYRTQFGVMRKYEEENLYDANGRLVPKDIAKAYRERGEQLTEAERRWTHPQSGVEYLAEFPFRGHDREEDMCEAYARFAEELERTGTVQ